MRSETINNTKIVATLGPASWHKDVMIEMIKAGVNVFVSTFHTETMKHIETLFV